MIYEDHSSPSYYCDEVDLCWLETVNKQKKLKGLLRSSTKFGLAFLCLFEQCQQLVKHQQLHLRTYKEHLLLLN